MTRGLADTTARESGRPLDGDAFPDDHRPRHVGAALATLDDDLAVAGRAAGVTIFTDD